MHRGIHFLIGGRWPNCPPCNEPLKIRASVGSAYLPASLSVRNGPTLQPDVAAAQAHTCTHARTHAQARRHRSFRQGPIRRPPFRELPILRECPCKWGVGIECENSILPSKPMVQDYDRC